MRQTSLLCCFGAGLKWGEAHTSVWVILGQMDHFWRTVLLDHLKISFTDLMFLFISKTVCKVTKLNNDYEPFASFRLCYCNNFLRFSFGVVAVNSVSYNDRKNSWKSQASVSRYFEKWNVFTKKKCIKHQRMMFIHWCYRHGIQLFTAHQRNGGEVHKPVKLLHKPTCQQSEGQAMWTSVCVNLNVTCTLWTFT